MQVMIDSRTTEAIFLVGIGGIGMSALARYFLSGGYKVAGYDRTASELTASLENEGCYITYNDDIDSLPEIFRLADAESRTVVVYTPAIPQENRILNYFREQGFEPRKRSEILGYISHYTDTLAVAGTHGKTTVSTILAHILKLSHLDCTAFLGGVSKNYDSNILLGEGRFTVMEADEFDRSFLRLTPYMAVITSADPDHLDIYGDYASMLEAYNEFCSLIRPGGTLLVNRKCADLIGGQKDISRYTYGFDDRADYHAFNITAGDSFYRFDMKQPGGVLRDIHFSSPGIMNVENAVAASALALLCGVTESDLRKALLCYRGIKRRFDLRVSLPEIVYIDDYAHHPVEIAACVRSVREQYPGRKITAVFQPHLYSRTRDHAATFAEELDKLDSVILMPVYPAREEPIPGIDTSLILKNMKLPGVKICDFSEVVREIDYMSSDVIITIGAGSIDRLVKPIEERIREIYGK